MKKLIVLVLAAAALAGAFYAYQMFVRPPENRLCARMADLCDLDAEDERECIDSLSKMAQNPSAKQAMDKAAGCVAEAGRCVEATGCLAGMGLSMVGDMVGGFIKGIEGVLSK